MEEYDAVNHSQLAETFCTLLGCDMSVAKTAEIMFLHKNTILQRKKKIEELYPFDPFSPVYRNQFQFIMLMKRFSDEPC